MAELPKLDCDSEVLSKFRLFAGFKQEELETLLSLCDCAEYAAGDVIVKQGEMGICMYVIFEGSVRVSFNSGQEIELAQLHAGDFFGELALVDDGPRSASVTAIESCRLLRVTRMVVGVLAGVQPSGAIHLLAAIGRSLVKRLRAGNQRYVDLILLGHSESTETAD